MTTVSARPVCLRFLLLAGLLAYAAVGRAGDLPADPFGSVMWQSMAERFFPGEQRLFDQRVKVMAPAMAEDPFNVPVTVDATALDDVVEIVVVADLNPIPHVLSLRPQQALSFIGFRLKLEQSSVIRVGARTGDGVWHLGGARVSAAGGGCTAPAMAHGSGNWMRSLGRTAALVRRESATGARVVLRTRHPMDTGLAPGIPAFYLSEVVLRDADSAVVAEVDLFEPISENPTLTLLPRVDERGQSWRVSARDTEGNTFDYSLNLPALVN